VRVGVPYNSGKKGLRFHSVPVTVSRQIRLRVCRASRSSEEENGKSDSGRRGRVVSVGRAVAELLLQQGKAVPAMVRKDDKRAQALRDMGADVVVGDLLDNDSMHRAIAGCDTIYFGMSVSDDYLAAMVNAAAVAKHYGVKTFINMSRMTFSQMSITESATSAWPKLHWLAGQALNWSGLPVLHRSSSGTMRRHSRSLEMPPAPDVRRLPKVRPNE